MLLKVKQFLLNKNCASLGEIARHCDADSSTVREIVKNWMDRGSIRRVNTEEHCGGCSGSCSCLPDEDTELYEWIES